MEQQGWNLEENYNLSTNRRSTRPQGELVELLWRDGQVILQSQTQKQNLHQENDTFLEDQETISWIQYSLNEELFETNEDFSSQFFSTVSPLERPASETVKHEAGPDPSPQVMLPPKFKLTDSSSRNKEIGKKQCSIGPSHCGSNHSMSHDRSKKLYPNTTSSSGGSSGYIKEMTSGRSITTDHKRKHITETDESMSQSDAIGKESNKRSTRRSRAAEVHNLSERRRRDRINERMKTLQELLPHCTKTDKASILDEAIDYLKSLQLQLQVMWMGSGMAATPMMFHGVQPPPPFIRQMQSPVQLSRFPVMDRSVIHNNTGLACQNPVQNQVFSDRFGRYIGGFPRMPAGYQSVDMFRFGSPAEQGGQQPSAPPTNTTTDGRRFGPLS